MNIRSTRPFGAQSLAIWLLVAGTVGPLRAAAPKPPEILGTKISGTNLLVRTIIPKGWSSVTLESRASADKGAWVPRGVSRSAGHVVFRVPASLNKELLQLTAARQDPLPASFYKGVREFASRSSTYLRPDQGSGQVLSLAATGALPGGATVPAAATASSTVEESDIREFNGHTLYFFNQLRGLQVIDITTPDNPVVTGLLPWPGVGQDMYLLDAGHVALLAEDTCSGSGMGELAIVDVSGTAPFTAATLPLPGYYQDSRLVGSTLCVAASGYDPAAGTNSADQQWGTVIASYDLSNPAAPAARSTLFFPGQENALLATNGWLIAAIQDWNSGAGSVVQILNCATADGSLVQLGSLTTAGTVDSDDSLGVNGATLAAISDSWQSIDPYTGGWTTTLETFSLTNPATPAALGSLILGSGEELAAVHFDGSRVYVATSLQTDPLWVVDLSNPASPVVAGSVPVPGWSSQIEPMGNQLLVLGIETNQVAVSLFDVSSPAAPVLDSQVLLGQNFSWSDALWDSKVLTVLPDLGLILVPYTGTTTNGWASAVQLIDLGTNSLTLRGQISQAFAPSRTAAQGGRILSLANEDLLTVNIVDQDHPSATSDLPLAWPVNQVFVQGNYLVEIMAGTGWSPLAQPGVRIASSAAPDLALNSLLLPSLPITGSTVRNGRLYLLQTPGESYPILFGTPIFLGGEGDPGGTNVVLTVVDLTALPALTILGQTVSPPPTNGPAGGSYTALWTADDVLLWFSTGFSFWANPVLDPLPIALASTPVTGLAVSGVGPTLAVSTNTLTPGRTGGTPSPAKPPTLTSTPAALNNQAFALIPYWWPWWGNGGVQLLAFNVSDPGNPQLVSSLRYNPTNSWGFSAPLVAQGLVFLTHEESDYSPEHGGYWRVRDILDVIDYTDPTTPTPRPSISAAGQLAAVSPDTSTLYFWGNEVNHSGNPYANRTAISACSYDGVSAPFVAALPLPQTWPQPVVILGNMVLLGETDASGTNGSLQSWVFTAGGKFVLDYAVAVSSPLNSLALAGYGLLAQDGNNVVTVFDPGSGAVLTTASPPGCSWIDLNRAAGTPATGLYFPLDDYGVFAVPPVP